MKTYNKFIQSLKEFGQPGNDNDPDERHPWMDIYDQWLAENPGGTWEAFLEWAKGWFGLEWFKKWFPGEK